jgi:uncharacterized protein YndB with AHSA1/START domain
MPDILHRVGIKSASPETIYQALTTREGLSNWWTHDTDLGDSDLIRFRFGENEFIDMKVLERDPGRQVLWQVVGGPSDWIGTRIRWELRQDGAFTTMLFKHEGWREPSEFMHACSTKWALFLMSLKSLVETGKGAPWPNDVKIYEAH